HVRAADQSSTLDLELAATTMAVLDGIKKRSEQHAPVDKDLHELPPAEQASIPQAPTPLESAPKALEADHDFLTEGDVFTEDLINTYIQYKHDNEIAPVRLRPTPQEFELYFDC